MGLLNKIIYLTLFTIISTSEAENNDTPSSINNVEDSSDSAQRSARYINSRPGGQYYQGVTGGGGYYYPTVNQYPGGGTTSFYPSRNPSYPNKFDPSFWLSKIPGWPTTSRPQGGYYPNNNYPNYPNYPNNPNNPNYPSYPSYPNYYPQDGTNWIGYNPGGNRNPGYYPGSTGGYYPDTTSGYYPTSGGYPAGNGGYGGYQGNGGFLSYNGYDGYYANGNRPGNIGFGYQNSRRTGILSTSGGLPGTLSPIVTPATVSKDAK